MEKYITNIKDLVIHALTNGSEIKAKADSGDALSCFQMGMIHLLGINTPIDFKKASKFLSNQSLSDDPDANRLLGFIAECEGNYSQAFKNYAHAGKKKKPFINKVYEERESLQSLFKKMDLPNIGLNEEITTILNEYIKGEKSKVDTIIKIAMICDDEESCLNAAQTLYDEGDYYSAMRWLLNGNIPENNTLYISVKKKISYSKKGQDIPNTLEVIEIESNSLLSKSDVITSYVGIRSLFDEATTSGKKEWLNIISSKISAIKKKIEEDEKARLKREKEREAALLKRQKQEEAERIKKQKDEERRAKRTIALEKKKEQARKEDRRHFIILVVVFVLSIIFSWYLGLSLAVSIGVVFLALIVTITVIMKYLI